MLGDSLAKSSLILEFSSDVPPSSFKPESNLDSEQDRNIISAWYLLPGVLINRAGNERDVFDLNSWQHLYKTKVLLF